MPGVHGPAGSGGKVGAPPSGPVNSSPVVTGAVVGGAVGAGIGAMIGAAWGWVTAPVTALRTLSPFASYLADDRLTAMGWEPMQQIVSAMGHDPNANVTQ